MESLPATMTKALGGTPLSHSLPEEIVVWEILVRLPPKSLLRCRAVCHTWHRATSTHDFLHAHHCHQPSLPIVCGSDFDWPRHKDILAFDHRAADAQLQPIARLDDSFCLEASDDDDELQSFFRLGGFFRLEASCDGLLILSKVGLINTCFSVCNPATRQHAPLRQLSSSCRILGMYAHRPTGDYRLLLHQTFVNQIGCYVYVLGSDQPPRYIGGVEPAVSACLLKPALVSDSLHWYPTEDQSDLQQCQTGSKVVVFNTTSESFLQMRAPVVSAESYIFEMDDTLGIYSCNDAMQNIDIWMLQNYESEVWGYKGRVQLPVAEITGCLEWFNEDLYASVESVDGDILLLVSYGGWMFHVDTVGKVVHNFHRDGQHVYACQLRLKQTLIPHTFFTALEGYAVNALPFV